ncbi:hypothetical protein TPCCA_0054a [Treponema paraluiscuniculi Cuniculi A]|uniref:Uncharacterized protein n=2 Tax=Treponema paraluiscuniculi TaxID=53435 RepID=F7XRP7_TREPU|nr:hypothetical protein TPCCA_0054a [Treponema paraluiscuniculi Cuniculi A]WKC71942.1 hypothetical protein TPLL2_0054a [Treponema paraluiscuniculi]
MRYGTYSAIGFAVRVDVRPRVPLRTQPALLSRRKACKELAQSVFFFYPRPRSPESIT